MHGIWEHDFCRSLVWRKKSQLCGPSSNHTHTLLQHLKRVLRSTHRRVETFFEKEFCFSALVTFQLVACCAVVCNMTVKMATENAHNQARLSRQVFVVTPEHFPIKEIILKGQLELQTMLKTMDWSCQVPKTGFKSLCCEQSKRTIVAFFTTALWLSARHGNWLHAWSSSWCPEITSVIVV